MKHKNNNNNSNNTAQSGRNWDINDKSRELLYGSIQIADETSRIGILND